MKLKAPRGVGAPCVAGVVVPARDGLYEAEAEIAALLIECFGFVAVDGAAKGKSAGMLRRSRAAKKKLAAEKPAAED